MRPIKACIYAFEYVWCINNIIVFSKLLDGSFYVCKMVFLFYISFCAGKSSNYSASVYFCKHIWSIVVIDVEGYRNYRHKCESSSCQLVISKYLVPPKYIHTNHCDPFRISSSWMNQALELRWTMCTLNSILKYTIPCMYLICSPNIFSIANLKLKLQWKNTNEKKSSYWTWCSGENSSNTLNLFKAISLYFFFYIYLLHTKEKHMKRTHIFLYLVSFYSFFFVVK